MDGRRRNAWRMTQSPALEYRERQGHFIIHFPASRNNQLMALSNYFRHSTGPPESERWTVKLGLSESTGPKTQYISVSHQKLKPVLAG